MGALKLSSVRASLIIAAFAPFVTASVEHASENMEPMLRSSRSVLDYGMEDMAAGVINKRQGAVETDESDIEEWEEDTLEECIEALSRLRIASNPSGTAVCYNLPSLDTTAGTFMADLRLFQISTPTGEFQNISPRDISVSVQYNGASVSPVSQQVNGEGLTETPEKRQTSSPTLLQTYMFIGQIDQAMMQQQTLSMTTVEAWVLPVVTLSARNAAGGTVRANVSSNEAAFVNGVFSDEVVLSDFSIAQLAVTEMSVQVQNGTVAFVLPGVNILIFPVALVITSIWVVIGIAAYGFGTYERYWHRESYRQRKARAGKGGNGRI